jgi:hypothetical protein
MTRNKKVESPTSDERLMINDCRLPPGNNARMPARMNSFRRAIMLECKNEKNEKK